MSDLPCLAGFVVYETVAVLSTCMNELVFEVIQGADGGFCAQCLTENIFTQADNWDELRRNVLEAVHAFFFDATVPERIRLHFVSG